MKKTILFLLCAGLPGACGYLDEDPRDQKPRDEVIASEATLYLNTLGNLYGMIGSDQAGEGLAGTYSGVYDLNTFTTDEAIMPVRGGDWYDGGLWERLYLHGWEKEEAPLKNAWSYLYKVIVLSNQAIRDLSSHSDWQQEARAVRALFYYYLLDMFGRVPIVTSPDVAMADIEQSSRAEVFRFVTTELENVLPFLSIERSNRPGPWYGRITQPVAVFLLTKLYLNAEVYTGTAAWDKVIDYCDYLADMGYELEPDYASNFAVYNEASKENIFTIPMDKHLYRAQNQYLFRSRHYDHAAAIGFTGENGASATLEVLDAGGFGEQSPDYRFDVNYWSGVPYDLEGRPIDLEYKPRSVALDVTGTPDEKVAGARMRKYEIDPSAMKDGKLMDNDWVIFRYADVLLMKAEALMRSGQSEDALPLVNTVRSRAGAEPLPELTPAILLEERMREFAWEGLRRQDQIRFGTYALPWSFRPSLPREQETRYTNLFPIPADILAVNPKLTQNDGYPD